jgi:ABC-2 type transport system permease protein
MAKVQYNQWRAMLAIAKASFLSILRNPSAVLFSLVVPFVFITIFGFIGGDSPSIRIAIDPNSDTSNQIYQYLKSNTAIRIITNESEEDVRKGVEKGDITALISITKNSIKDSSHARYTLHTTTAAAGKDKFPLLQMVLKNLNGEIEAREFPERKQYADLSSPVLLPTREYKMIDFILPGMLGFSLLGNGVFGVAFLFYNMRQTLVLKRFFATPVKRTYIVLGEGLGRVAYQMVTAVVIIGVGYYLFHFTLVRGWETFLEMLLVSFLGLAVFMGFGFIISSFATSEQVIPLFSNVITLPQFLLAGTFFSVAAFPNWLQHICDILPLKQFNDAMRSIAFEGSTLWEVKAEIGYLLAWGIVVYAFAIRVFKWE